MALSRAIVSGVGNVQMITGLLFMLGMLDAAHAAADFKKCCVMAARASFALFLPTYPWDACAVNSNATGSSAPINPSVNATLGWCEQNCPGYQRSTTTEWLHPITTWIIPYAGLLFLCPIGERGEAAADRSVSWFISKLVHFFAWLPKPWRAWSSGTKDWTTSMMKWISNVIFAISEYAGYLGDPASAIWGSFSELAEDWWLSGIVLHKPELRRELVATVILTGQSHLDGFAEKQLTSALITRFLLDIVEHEDPQQYGGTQDEKAQNTGSEITTPVDDIHPDIPPMASKEVRAVVVAQDPLPSLTIKQLRKKLEDSLKEEGEDIWDGINMNKIAKAVLAIAEGKDAPDDLFSDGRTNRFTAALAQVLATYNKRPAPERRSFLVREGTFTHRLWDGIRILLEARVDFVSTILIPVILMLVVTASVFYDAYQALGDNDTAHSLAYGLLYSWLIILAVAGNCYTASLTSGLVERTIGNDACLLSVSPVTVGLRDRYVNALRWRGWLSNVGVIDDPGHGTTSTLFKYLAGQLFGWVCVAAVASCGAAISYTTPTVGIGCRSFNMLLYALVSLVVCLLPVLLYWNELREIKGGQKNTETFRKYTSGLYRFLVFANGCVLVIGTLLHLVGVFRSCWCMNVFAHASRVLELNTQTAQAVHNATVYWLPVGYVAFIFIWCVSASAIVMREVINFRVGIAQGLHLGERMGIRGGRRGGGGGGRNTSSVVQTETETETVGDDRAD